MSFITNPAMPLIVTEDKSCLDESWGGESFIATPVILDLYMGEDTTFGNGLVGPWWPKGASVLQNTGDLSDVDTATWFHSYYPVSGCNGRLSFVGVTRDQYGSPIANCTVRCYLVSTGELISQVFSDANGAFTITSPYSAAHFLTTHNTGVAGATLDTLIPS